MSHFVFFIQLEPDVDHLAPIAYRLNRDKPGTVTIICVNPLFDIDSDYRLHFLREEGVKIFYLSKLGIFSHPLFTFTRCLICFPKFILKLIPVRVWSKIYFKNKLNRNSLIHFFRSQNTKVVTIDEAHPVGQLETIVQATKECGIFSIRVTSGNPALLRKTFPHPNTDGIKFDYQLRSHLLAPEGPIASEDIKEVLLGCMRYNEEWERINEKLLANLKLELKLDFPNKKGKMKVLIFERSTQGFTKDHQVVSKLRAMDFCDVMFRSRPRILQPKKLYTNTLDALPSALLIQWADVVICSVSSIALDVLYYKKVLLYPKFIAPKQEATFEALGACWKVESVEELMAAIQNIHEGAKGLPYAVEQVKNFFTQAVYCSDSQYDVLKAYSRFYQSLSE